MVNVSSSDELERYIKGYLDHRKAKIAYGGYLEQRGIYNRSDYFNKNNSDTERHIHLGLDFWVGAGTPVFSPLDGVVHSYKNNTNYGDYGPTIVLEHHFDTLNFYTLYGHLSLQSLEHKYVGELVKKGQQMATLGTAMVNGDYPPHLHFQVIEDIQGYYGDYPGVSSKMDLAFYKKNCPDPNILLKLV